MVADSSMSTPTPDVRLLRLAEEIGVLDATVGAPVLQERLRETLDRTAHAVVDLALGHTRPTPGRDLRQRASGRGPRRPVPGPDARQPAPGVPVPSADRASCSALAARAHSAAAQLAPAQAMVPDTPMAQAVRAALIAVADGLQDYAQDLADPALPDPPRAHRGLDRALDRAVTALGAGDL